jgi:hypothetical protein
MTSTLITLAAIIKFVTALREFFKRLFGIKSESEEKLHIYYERRNKTPVGQPKRLLKSVRTAVFYKGTRDADLKMLHQGR